MTRFKSGRCVLLTFVLMHAAYSAPSYSSTTEVSRPLTTVKYYDNPTPNYRISEYEDYYEEQKRKPIDPSIPTLKTPSISPSELIMTLAKTALDIVRRINQMRANNTMNANVTITNGTSNKEVDKPRGIDHHEIYYSDISSHDYHHHQEEPSTTSTTTTAPEAPMMSKPRYSDPWSGYYDFIINEGSFKFWSGFQLFTAALLLYSALSAIYYAKFNPIQPDYDTTYDDYFFGRSLDGNGIDPSTNPSSASPDPGWISSLAGMGSQAYQRIMDTLYSPQTKYS